MTSEAVRLRFRTPTPYYPYREPVAGKARFAARNLLVWFATQEDAFSAPSDAGASGWTQPAFAVASAPSEDGVTTWKQPWAPGWRSSVTAKELRDSLPSLAEIVPGEETSRWVVVPFRDARENRDGWGDVLIPPGAPVAVNDASIAARWRLLPVLDPHLEGSPDEAPLGAASLVRPSPPTSSAHKGDASSPLPGADRFPERRASGGCALGQGATSEDGVWLVGAIAALAYVARRRRRSLAIVAVIGLSACKEDSTSAPAPWRTEAGTFVVPGGNPVFSRDGSQILVESRGTIRVHDIATGREILRFTIPSQTTDAAPTTSSRIVQMVPLPRQRLLVTTEESNPDRFLLEIDEITGDGARQRWRETIATGEHLLNVKLAVSASGSLAMTADQSGTLRLWDLDALRELPTIVAGGRGLSHVAFAGSEYVITALQMPAPGGDRSEFHVWDLARGREERSFAGPTAFVSALATTVDGSRAVTVDSAEGLRVWDVAAGRELFGLDLSNLGDNWRAAVANPWDGTHALALRSGLVCALDVVAGAPVDCTRSPAFWSLRDPAFTPDGHLVAWSGQDSRDSDIHYWRLPDRVAPGMPPTWPATPPWPTPYYEYVARLPRQADRSAHERAVLDVMLGRVRPERIPAGAQPNTPGVSSRAIGPGRVDDGMVPPGVTVKIGEATATVPVTNAAAVLKTMRAGFRRCYVEGLNVDPTGAGRVTLSVTISPSGEVVSGEASENSGVSESVVQCVFRTVRGARFDAPGPKGSTLQVAIWFISET
jgi:MYXO-CTERM domain-containing protein